MDTILTIHKLHKTFGKIHAVNDVSFSIQKGNVYGILGPNGSGKSTTLGIILNVVNKTSGNFFWFDGKINTHEALKKVGAIIERPNFYPYMTAVDNLKLVCKIKGVSYSKIDQKLKDVNLFERKDSKFSTFSLGMKQRLAIASALLNDPEILILDEPTNGLDPQGIHEIRGIIKKISLGGTTILLASHLLDEVEKVCDHVIVLRKGRMLYSGKVDEMGLYNQTLVIKTDHNITTVREILKHESGVLNIHPENEFLILQIEKNIDAGKINKLLMENGVILSHLEIRKPNLEQKFLDLTNQID